MAAILYISPSAAADMLDMLIVAPEVSWRVGQRRYVGGTREGLAHWVVDSCRHQR